MLDTKEFSKIQKDLEASDASRERIIRTSRDIIKLSKLVINSLHRNELPDAKKSISEMQKLVKSLSKIFSCEGIAKCALQEYAEAMAYFYFVTENRIPSLKELQIPTEEYLCGLCDLTGELVRRAVNDVINGNPSDALKARQVVDELNSEFLKFNLPNGELRKKYDSIKWNLKKLDEIALSLKLKHE